MSDKLIDDAMERSNNEVGDMIYDLLGLLPLTRSHEKRMRMMDRIQKLEAILDQRESK
jgi:hypothetical protein